jgi:hypothetical protein
MTAFKRSQAEYVKKSFKTTNWRGCLPRTDETCGWLPPALWQRGRAAEAHRGAASGSCLSEGLAQPLPTGQPHRLPLLVSLLRQGANARAALNRHRNQVSGGNEGSKSSRVCVANPAG